MRSQRNEQEARDNGAEAEEEDGAYPVVTRPRPPPRAGKDGQLDPGAREHDCGRELHGKPGWNTFSISPLAFVDTDSAGLTPVPKDSPTTPCKPIAALSMPIVAKPKPLCQDGADLSRVNAASLQ